MSDAHAALRESLMVGADPLSTPTQFPSIHHLLWQWTGEAEPGFEHLQLTWQPGRVDADGAVMGVDQAVPFRLHYRVQCDAPSRPCK